MLTLWPIIAEEDVNPNSPRKVRFAEDPVSSVVEYQKWYVKLWGAWKGSSEDHTTKEEDDAAIAALEEGAPPDSFNSYFQGMMATKFDDESDDDIF